jgi:hypothetical protein
MYVCVYVCKYVRTYVCMYVFMYLFTYIFVFQSRWYIFLRDLQKDPVVVVVDRGNSRLSLWRLNGVDGICWKVMGSEGRLPGQFTDPRAVAVLSSGALVVTDEHRVQVLTVDGAVLGVLNTLQLGVAGVGPLGEYLRGVTVCAGTDDILVVDSANCRVVELMWTRAPSNVRRCLFSKHFNFYVDALGHYR